MATAARPRRPHRVAALGPALRRAAARRRPPLLRLESLGAPEPVRDGRGRRRARAAPAAADRAAEPGAHRRLLRSSSSPARPDPRDDRPRRRRELRAVPRSRSTAASPSRSPTSRSTDVRSHLVDVDPTTRLAYFAAESRDESIDHGVRANLATGRGRGARREPVRRVPARLDAPTTRGSCSPTSTLSATSSCTSPTATAGAGSCTARRSTSARRATTTRSPGFSSAHVTVSGAGILVVTTLFDDAGSPGYLDLDGPGEIEPVAVDGLVHEGDGELERLEHLEGDRYAARLQHRRLLVGVRGVLRRAGARADGRARPRRRGELADGVLHGLHFDEGSGRFAISFCTATTPTQLYVLERRTARDRHGTRASARSGSRRSSSRRARTRRSSRTTACASRPASTFPSPELGFEGPRPLVYYVHGGPQGQERPNFAWFSMPLIQILTLEGFAVFVPNVRGSTGYGLQLHEARRPRLGRAGPPRPRPRDDRGAAAGRARRRRARRRGRPLVRRLHDADARRTPSGAVARGGRHVRPVRPAHVPRPHPRDLEAVLRARRSAIPETRPRLPRRALADARYIDDIACPLLVIQGQNDPRVVERESHDLVERAARRRARTSTTSSSRTRATTCSSSRTACAATRRSSGSSPSISALTGRAVGDLRIAVMARRLTRRG